MHAYERDLHLILTSRRLAALRLRTDGDGNGEPS